MSVSIVYKGSFSVIGKLGQGPSSEGHRWIHLLWQEANNQFDEIRSLAKTDREGNIIGIWGAMSDMSESFQPWTDHGKYLAGCEVHDDSDAPPGWTKWVIPSNNYAVIKCNLTTYQDEFKFMLQEYLPKNAYSLAGAVHEYYDPMETDGDLYLYFPIEKMTAKRGK